MLKFKTFIGIETLEQCHILKRRHVLLRQLERIYLPKDFSSLLHKRLLFVNSKDNFLLETFLQHREQKLDEHILNY
jgi:hypothetical protein